MGRFRHCGAQKFRDVGTRWQADQELRPAPLLAIVLREAPPHFACRDPDYGVLASVVIRGTVEDLDTDGALFKSVRFLCDCLVDDVVEELPAAAAGVERRALEQTVYV